MTTAILAGQDMQIALWTFQEFNLRPMQISSAFGILKDNQLKGSIIFQHFNGCNVEVSYYGPNTATLGMLRFVCTTALDKYKVERMTARTPKTNPKLINWWYRLGAKFEANLHRYYGSTYEDKHTAVQVVMFKETMELILRRGKTVH